MSAGFHPCALAANYRQIIAQAEMILATAPPVAEQEQLREIASSNQL